MGMGTQMRGEAIGRALAAVHEQSKWIEECGGSLPGYILRYGSKEDPEHYGDGGEAIWAADYAELQKREARVRELDK